MKLTSMNRIIFLLCIVLFLFNNSNAQTQPDTGKIYVNDNKLYVIIKHDGTEFIGKIISKDAREYLMDTKNMGFVFIPKHEIQEVREIKPGDINAFGEYIPTEIFSTRYFITANSLPIERGESYIVYNVFGPDFEFGVGKNFGFGIMTSWVGIPIIGTAKYSFNINEKVNVGVGTLLGTGSWAQIQSGLALPYGTITFGDRKRNINFSGGYGALVIDGDQQGRALFSIGAMTKAGKRISIVFDSFIIPPGSYHDVVNSIYDPTTNSFTVVTTKERDPGIALMIPGIRWQNQNRSAFQMGFAGVIFDGEAVPIPFPFLQWFKKL